MLDLKFPPGMHQFLSLDLPPILSASFCAVACALLGNYLVLRRLSLMGDAISHAILPGIVIAFLISGSRESVVVFMGAAAAGILTAVLIEAVQKLGRMESSAAMGVIFSILFALGVLLIEQAAARSVDLDADCLLHGQLESIFWFPPDNVAQFFSWNTFSLLPYEVISSFAVCMLTVLFVIVLFKELQLSSFDPALGTALGFPASYLHFGLLLVVAAAVVASFTAVGSILVIAMIICPAASARMLTDRLKIQVILSVAFALCCSIGGYLAAAFLPPLLGWNSSVNAAGSMAVVSGVLLAAAVIFSPSYGLIARFTRTFRLSLQVLKEDILGFLYRREELMGSEPQRGCPLDVFPELLLKNRRFKLALGLLLRNRLITAAADGYTLAPAGRAQAATLVRAHRLWETYLLEHLNLPSDHIHKSAAQLEHFTDRELSRRLAERQSNPETDPHGKPIPQGAKSGTGEGVE